MAIYKNTDTDFLFIWNNFHNELVKLTTLVDKTKSNDYNRVFVRSLFSMIEGMTYRIRQILLHRYKNNEINLTTEQALVLKESSVYIDDTGICITKQKNYRFENLVRFTFKTYCDIYKKKEILDKYISDNRYCLFKDAIKIRNRVTHPKTGNDIFVNGRELILLLSVENWFDDLIFDIFEGDLLQKQ